MGRRAALAVTGWLVAAVAATGTGLAAVQVIGAGLTDPAGEVRSAGEVARALDAPARTRATSVPTSPSVPPASVPPASVPPASVPPASVPPASVPPASVPPASVPPASVPRASAPSTSALASRQAFSSAGGTVVAQCDGRDVRLVSWTPAQGYRVEDAEPGPDDEAEMTFVGSANEVEVEVRCEAGQPVASWTDKDHD